MILLVIKPPHMPQYQLFSQIKPRSYHSAFARIICESSCIYRIVDDLHPSRLHGLFTEGILSRERGTGETVIRLLCQMPSEELRCNTFGAFHHAGISGMRHRDGYSALLRNRQIDTGSACHMALHHPKFMMLPEKVPHGLPVSQIIIDPKLGQHINTSPKSFDLFLIILRFPGSTAVHQEVKLYLAAVHLSVQIHNTALRTAKTNSAQHMKHANHLCHASLHFYPNRFRKSPLHLPLRQFYANTSPTAICLVLS